MRNSPIASAREHLRRWLEENEFEHKDSAIMIVASHLDARTWVGFFEVRSLPGMVYQVEYTRADGTFEYAAYEKITTDIAA